MQRLNRWLYPDTAERTYQRLFIKRLRELKAEFLRRLRGIDLLRIDAEEETWSDDLELTIAALMGWWFVSVQALRIDFAILFNQVSQFNDKQFRLAVAQLTNVSIPQSQSFGLNAADLVTPTMVARDILGQTADVSRIEEYIAAIKKNFVATSVTSFDKLGQQFIQTSEIELRRLVNNGAKVNEIIANVNSRLTKYERQAVLISRGIVARVNAELTQRRLVGMGLNEYIWHTCLDERVRPTHRANEGEKFQWSKPPAVTGHPGHDYLCRCWPEAVK